MGIIPEGEKPITQTIPAKPQPELRPNPQKGATLGQETSSLDYVALAATLMLGVVSCVALYAGDSEPALVSVGAVAGYVTRLYR